MVVGVLKLSLILAENHSLKEKRGVLKKIQARVSNQFNISVTECGDQDLWQSSVLGFSVVGSSRQVVEATLEKVVDFVDQLGLAQVSDSETELFFC
ncbi:MAG TPA: DUF503 domain-containing protein [Candidatus Binatia bacterium]|jgi:hypothetical protein|nr:DUF503 domain-containing protein [Candidatus Binatia bacterium]